MRTPLIVWFLALNLFSIFSCGNPDEDFENIYKTPEFEEAFVRIATSVAAVSTEKAFAGADSLLKISENDYQKMKVQMLFATLEQRQGNIAEAIARATLAASVADRFKFKSWEVRIAGFLSTSYRGADLPTEARKYLTKAEIANSRLKAHPGYPQVQMMIHQEKAYFLIEEDKDFVGAQKELEKANALMEKIPDEMPEKKTFQAMTYHLYGESYWQLNEKERAEEYFTRAEKVLEDFAAPIRPLIWLRLGDLECSKKEYGKAMEFYEKVAEAAEGADMYILKLHMHQSLSSYYHELGDNALALKHSEKYTALLSENNDRSKRVYNEVLSLLNQEKEKNIMTGKYFMGIIVSLMFMIVFLVFYYSYAIRKGVAEKRGRRRLSFFRHRGESVPAGLSDSIQISTDTEARLLLALKDFEEDAGYLRSRLSINTLADQWDTNAKYVGYIIRKHRESDFASYINGLRIQAILQDIAIHEEYLHYKLSVLARQYGFTSHATFSNAFKKETGKNPSDYFSALRKELEEGRIS